VPGARRGRVRAVEQLARITRKTDSDFESLRYPVLKFTSGGQPRLVADVFVSDGESGLYYFQPAP
jgi:hypothetical protein